MSDNYFSRLNAVNVQDKVEKKNGMSYLSWAWAWGEVKKLHPDATYRIYETPEGRIYHTDGKTCWVKTGVTVNGIEHIEYLPVMDMRNKSIPLAGVTSMDVNKAIQRSITKACARHGLGLYLYAGEDLPEDETPPSPPPNSEPEPPAPPSPPPASAPEPPVPLQWLRNATLNQMIEYIKQNADDVLYTNAKNAYGDNLEKLTNNLALKLICRIDKSRIERTESGGAQ
jgi:hypothetical protein